MTKIDLRSDTVTVPSQPMREAIYNAEVGDDVFDEDPTVNDLQEIAAGLFGMEASLFVPSGTMANEIAINVCTDPGDEIIVDDKCHIMQFESGAPGLLSGVNAYTIPTETGIINADDIENRVRPDQFIYPKSVLVSIENSHNYGGGVVYSIEQIRSISKIAAKHGLHFHMDGARIFNAAISSKESLSSYGTYVDSMTVSLCKGLGAPVGGLLLGSKKLIDRSKKVRKIFGGGMRQAGILAAAGIYALEHNIDRLSIDHEHAQMIALALNTTESFNVDMASVQTNIVIANIIDDNLGTQEVVDTFAQHDILIFGFGRNRVRFVTHLDVSKAQCELVCERIKNIFN